MQRNVRILLAIIGLLLIVLCGMGYVLLRGESSTASEDARASVADGDVPPGKAVPTTTYLTAGVILTGAAQEYGWFAPYLQNTPYAETSISGIRVIVYDQLNPTQNPGVPLEWVIKQMLDLGANVIFVSTGYTSVPDEHDFIERFSQVPLIMNRADRASVEELLQAFARVQTPQATIEAQTAQIAGPPIDAPEQESNASPLPLVAIVMISVVTVWALRNWWGNFSPTTSAEAGPISKSKRWRIGPGAQERAQQIEEDARSRASDFVAQGTPLPALHVLSTYVLGDTLFDETFSIELSTGEFLGQCGVSPAGYLSDDRERVTALDIWLFDKQAGQTVNTHVASQHIYHNTHLRTELERKGAVLPAEPETIFLMETRTLRVQVRVLDLQYGFSDVLSPNSFFDFAVIELAVWQR